MQALRGLSPVSWLMELAAGQNSLSTWGRLGVSGGGMAALSLLLYRKRMDEGETL